MLIIDCPFCGSRDEREFTHGGPDFGPRPDNAGDFNDDDWVKQLIVPDNPLGSVSEWWWHERGCGSWMLVVRDTKTHEILSVQESR